MVAEALPRLVHRVEVGRGRAGTALRRQARPHLQVAGAKGFFVERQLLEGAAGVLDAGDAELVGAGDRRAKGAPLVVVRGLRHHRVDERNGRLFQMAGRFAGARIAHDLAAAPVGRGPVMPASASAFELTHTLRPS